MKLSEKILECYTAQELEKFYTDGETQVLAYRKAFQLRHVPTNEKGFGLLEFERYRKTGGLPYTRRGRHCFFTPEYAKRVIDA